MVIQPRSPAGSVGSIVPSPHEVGTPIDFNRACARGHPYAIMSMSSTAAMFSTFSRPWSASIDGHMMMFSLAHSASGSPDVSGLRCAHSHSRNAQIGGDTYSY
jgi:hypothetical protein